MSLSLPSHKSLFFQTILLGTVSFSDQAFSNDLKSNLSDSINTSLLMAQNQLSGLDDTDSFESGNSIPDKTLVDDFEMVKDIEGLQGPNIKNSNSKRYKYIKHPGQKQGLYKITADGRYYYKVDESKKKYGLAIKGGALILNQLKNNDTDVRFKDIYGNSAKPAVYIEYYWSFFKDRNVPNLLKKARVKIGSGLFFASGTGSFSDPNYQNVEASENFTFLAFPNTLGLHLAFEFKDKQLIVPFVTGALEYLVGIELQNDNFGRTKYLGQLGSHFGGGIMLSLGWLEESAKFDLDSEFGINQTYFTVELRQNVAIQSDFDFTASSINAGIQFEF